MVDDYEAMLTAVLILVSPVIFALPVSFAWRWWVGIEPEHEHYREKVRRVLDAGMPLARYRGELDAEARKVHISSDRQGRIESDLLHRLRLQHFLLFPSLILWPLVGIFAAIISIPMMPLLKLVEWILIKKKALSGVAIIIQRYTRWEIIGIPRLDDGSKQFGKALASIHRMPTTVFLGLFAYLIVSYSPMSSFNVLLLSALVYIILVSAISVIRAATESTWPRGVLTDAVDAGQGGVAGGEEDTSVDELELTRTKVCDVGASRALTTKLTALPKSQDRGLNGDHTLVKSTSLLLSLTFSIREP